MPCTADDAANVLWYFGMGGYPGGSFTKSLLEAWARADCSNKARLALVFPGLAYAIELANLPGGVERLKEIAAP